MKKSSIIVALMLVGLISIGCGGNSIERDAKKIAKLECKAQRLREKATSSDMSVIAESKKLSEKAKEMLKKAEAKYNSSSDQEKFAESFFKELMKCE